MLSYSQILSDSCRATLQAASEDATDITYKNLYEVQRLAVFENIAPVAKKKKASRKK